MAELDDEHELVGRAARGDAGAIGDLYRCYAPAVFRYLFYRLGDRDLAEDLTSEVFVRALEALPRYRRQGRPFSAWLYRIAGARVADHYRRRHRRPVVPLGPDLPARAGDPGDMAEIQLTTETLQRAISQLTALQQQVVVLRFLEGLPHSKVAQILGRSEGAVRVVQFRALEALRRLLTQEQ